eukprot:6481184-Amphidinium_carterae.1
MSHDAHVPRAGMARHPIQGAFHHGQGFCTERRKGPKNTKTSGTLVEGFRWWLSCQLWYCVLAVDGFQIRLCTSQVCCLYMSQSVFAVTLHDWCAMSTTPLTFQVRNALETHS